MKIVILTAVMAAALQGGGAKAAVRTRLVEYRQGEAVMEGFLAWDDAVAGRRPGVIVVHDWTGLNDYARSRAEQLAKMGYVAFAIDVYGKGVRPASPQAAAAQSSTYKNDRKLTRARALAGLDVLRQSDLCDPKRIAVIGYCFGGMVALEIARSGADVAGVVTFHGALDTPTPGDAKQIKCKVLALHGGDDPHVPQKDVEAFEDEMRGGGVDWQLIVYGGAVHSFSNPAAGSDKSKGSAYNAAADRRSWAAMQQFFAEIFQR